MSKKHKLTKHRALYDKARLVRQSTASLAMDPTDGEARLYLKGLCDAMHGSAGDNEELSLAIHVGRATIIAVQE